jgi:ABC-type uncharacterized transport system permease subunit
VSDAAIVLFLEASVRLGVPLALAALGEAITERSGVINIGLEGSLIAGALGGALTSLALGSGEAGVLAGAGAGLAVALVFAAFSVGLGTDQIITGTAITLGGLGFTGAIYQASFGASGAALTLPTVPPLRVPVLADIPWVGTALFAQAPTTYVAYLLAPPFGSFSSGPLGAWSSAPAVSTPMRRARPGCACYAYGRRRRCSAGRWPDSPARTSRSRTRARSRRT